MLSVEAWFAIAAGAMIIAIALILISRRFSQPRNNVELTVNDVLNAITPYLYRAVIAGERAVLWGMEGLDAQIQSADKKKVADSIYNLLPDVIVVREVPLPIGTIKEFVPPEEFERWVKDAYDATDAFIQKNEKYLKSQVEALKPT